MTVGRTARQVICAALLGSALLGSALPAAGQVARVDGLEPTGRWTPVPVGSAPTPPMGWSSWNAFGVDITEARVLGSARTIVDTGLARAGYRSINVDDGWWLRRRPSDGRLQVRTNLFPSAATGGVEGSSLRPFVDRLHAMGLKAGIYTDIGRNACSQAYTPDNPNLPEGTVAEREVGLYGHVAQDIALFFGDWKFDYVKIDGCGLSAFGADRLLVASGRYRAFPPLVVDADVNRTDVSATRALFEKVRDALRSVRPAGDYVLSLCLWGAANVRSWGEDVGTMSRTSNDIDASWGRLLHNFDSVSTRELYAGPGRWNDPDMLEIGNGIFDAAHLTEARTHMSLWAIEAAPLVIGTDLTHAPKAIIDVLTAPEVVAVDQDPAGNQGVLAYTDDERQIVVKTLADGRKAVALFNRTGTATQVTLTNEHLKLAPDSPVRLRDLWGRREIGTFTGQRVFDLKPRETLLLAATGAPLLAGDGYYLSERPALIHVARDGIRDLEPDPIIHRMMDPYNPGTTSGGNRPVYAGWGAPRADATPYDQSLRVAGDVYRYGLGALGDSRMEVRLAPNAKVFEATVGVADSSRGKHGRLRFDVYGDGRLLVSSRPMAFGAKGQKITADVHGVRVLELVARQEHGTAENMVACWGYANVA